LIHSKELTFTDPDPVVQNNPLSPHGPTVNMIQVCAEDGLILNAQDIKTPLVPIHIRMCEATMFSHNHGICKVWSVDPRGCAQVQSDVQGLLDRRELVVTRRDEGKNVCVVTPVFKTREPLVMTPNGVKLVRTPLVICCPGSKPYTSQKTIPYKYECTILEDNKEMPLNTTVHVDNIANSSRILRSGRVLPAMAQVKTSVPINEPMPEQNPGKGKAVGQSDEIICEDSDGILKLIKKSEYKVVDQLLQTPAKISIMSLLTNSDAHREAL